MILNLTIKQRQQLVEHSIANKPNEACAILYGTDAKIDGIYFAQNIDKSPTSFAISNNELIKAYKEIEDAKSEVVAIFHSHPNSQAVPSVTDEKYMSVNQVVWIIYSISTKEFKAYRLEQDDVKKVDLCFI